MGTVTPMPHMPLATVRLLASAPHRLLFFVGATNVLSAMAWWAYWLVAMRWFGGVGQPVVPAGWLHAILMQYHVLPAFIFGFLLTVFPRWMNLAPLTARQYAPVAVGLLGGQLLTLAGVIGGIGWLRAGAALTVLGWLIGTITLVRLTVRDEYRTWHAVSCTIALAFGLFGLTCYTLFLFRFEPRLAFVAIKLGGTAVLLPIFVTVCHRMLPFFASAVVPGYRVIRPMPALAVIWIAAVGHTLLELRHGYAYLWLADVPLVIATAALAWRWWPRASQMPPLLAVLFVGFAWLPLAFTLYAVQSAWFGITGEFILGRAPAHALFVGYFGSLLVAMVTRVTQGHSGRPLVLGVIPAVAFVLVQATAIVRILAEVMPDVSGWHAIAGLAWLVAFLPWVCRSAWIYLTPSKEHVV